MFTSKRVTGRIIAASKSLWLLLRRHRSLESKTMTSKIIFFYHKRERRASVSLKDLCKRIKSGAKPDVEEDLRSSGGLSRAEAGAKLLNISQIKYWCLHSAGEGGHNSRKI